MLQSFTGILENGTIHWEEPQRLPNKAKVVVTVLEEIRKREFGYAFGKVHLSSDFDEPLEEFNDYIK